MQMEEQKIKELQDHLVEARHKIYLASLLALTEGESDMAKKLIEINEYLGPIYIDTRKPEFRDPEDKFREFVTR
jgi:hypothetical protein